MPVHSRGDKKETNHHDEMEVDYAENEGSSSEDEDTESSSVSEDGDSSGALLSWAGMPGPLRRAHDRPRRSRRAVRPAASTGRGDGEGAGTDSASGTRSCGARGLQLRLPVGWVPAGFGDPRRFCPPWGPALGSPRSTLGLPTPEWNVRLAGLEDWKCPLTHTTDLFTE